MSLVVVFAFCLCGVLRFVVCCLQRGWLDCVCASGFGCVCCLDRLTGGLVFVH